MLYISVCVLRIVGVRRSVRSGRYFAKGTSKPLPWVLLGIPLVAAAGQIIARVMAGALSYKANQVIGTIGIFFLIFLGAFGSHLYLCFYYMRKYKAR